MSDPIFRRLQQLFGLARITTAPDDSAAIQRVQVTRNDHDTRDRVPVMQLFGFSSAAPVGSDVVLLTLTGDSSASVVVGTNHQPSRLRGLQPGQVALYDAAGSKIVLSADGGIVISPAAGGRIALSKDGGITIEPASGVLTVQGEIHATGDVKTGGLSFQQHVHGGVERGSGRTGQPV